MYVSYFANLFYPIATLKCLIKVSTYVFLLFVYQKSRIILWGQFYLHVTHIEILEIQAIMSTFRKFSKSKTVVFSPEPNKEIQYKSWLRDRYKDAVGALLENMLHVHTDVQVRPHFCFTSSISSFHVLY